MLIETKHIHAHASPIVQVYAYLSFTNVTNLSIVLKHMDVQLLEDHFYGNKKGKAMW